LALAADAEKAVRTEGVWVRGIWVAVTAGGKRRLALTINTLVSSRAQAIWVVRRGVAVATLLEATTLDTGFRGGASRVFGRRLRIAVAARRKRGLALAVDTHVPDWTKTVRILSSGVTVAALFETSATNTGL